MGLPSNAVIFLTVTSFMKRKGPITLLTAFMDQFPYDPELYDNPSGTSKSAKPPVYLLLKVGSQPQLDGSSFENFGLSFKHLPKNILPYTGRQVEPVIHCNLYFLIALRIPGFSRAYFPLDS